MFAAVLEVAFQLFFEVAVQLTGYGLLRCAYSESDVELESGSTKAAGIVFWVAVGGVIAVVVRFR